MASMRMLMSRQELGVVVGVVVVALLCMAVGYAAIADEPDPYCFSYELGLFVWGGLVVLVAAFIGALVLAVLDARISAYLLLVAALAIAIVLGYAAGLEAHGACGPPLDDAAAVSVISLIPVGVGLVPGFVLGRLLRRLGRVTDSP